LSQQLSQNAFFDLILEKCHLFLGYIRQLPVSYWCAAVVVVSSIWLVRSAASLFWLVFPVPEVEQPTVLALPLETLQSKSSPNVSYDTIASLSDVFGTSAPIPQATIEPEPADTDVPDDAAITKLRLKLHGVFASNDPRRGSAIIADGNKQVLYSIDDEIEGNRGVKLGRVLEKRVILDNKGKFESLWLFSEEDFQPTVSSASKRTKRRDVGSAEVRRSASDSRNAIRTSARPDQIPKNIGDVVRFSVHREGGKMVGYRIRPGRERELFNQVGLRANDIVTSVNGIEVNDPKQIRSVYKSMKTATEAQLIVLRDGETHSITISLDSDA